MKILYISSFIYRKNSSASIRNNKLIEGIVELGHSVDVITIKHFDDRIDSCLEKNHNQIGVNVLATYSVGESKVVNAGSNKLKSLLPKTFYRFLKNLLAYPDADKNWLKETYLIDTDYDYIISSSDTKTSHFIAKKILKDNDLKSKWIQIWGDPWAEDINLDFLTKLRVSFSEHNLLKEAHKVFYVSELTANDYKNKYPKIKNKIFTVGRSYYKEVFSDSQINEYELNIFYPGGINENRNIDTLCKSIDKHNQLCDFKIKLRICGHQSEEILRHYHTYSFIEFLGSKTIDEVNSELTRADCLLFIDNGAKSTQIPGKIFDYYGTNLPIIALVNPDNFAIKEFLLKDENTIIFNRNAQDIDLEKLLNVKKIERVNKYYSPILVAKRFLNEL